MGAALVYSLLLSCLLLSVIPVVASKLTTKGKAIYIGFAAVIYVASMMTIKYGGF